MMLFFISMLLIASVYCTPIDPCDIKRCDAGEICIAGECKDINIDARRNRIDLCNDDRQCDHDERCVQGHCVDIDGDKRRNRIDLCNDDRQCDHDERCVQGHCVDIDGDKRRNLHHDAEKLCALNEELKECGLPMEPTCEMPKPPLSTLRCFKKNVCQCRDGFLRHSNGQCVAQEKCT